MGLKDFYYKLEDNYFKFLDNLDKKGIKVYNIIDPLEKKGIHTFPILSLIFIAILIFIIYAIIASSTGGVSASNNVNLTFLDSSRNPIIDESIAITLNGSEKTVLTNENGIATLKNLDLTQIYTLEVVDSKYKLDTQTLTLNLSSQKNYELYLSEIDATISKTIVFKNNSGELITDDLTVSFICSGNIEYATDDLTVVNGEITLDDVPSDCGVLTPYIYDNYNTQRTEDLEANTVTGEVYLSGTETLSGSLFVNVLDKETNVGIGNINVRLINLATQVEVDSFYTNNNGSVIFENVTEGTYLVYASDTTNTYGPIAKTDYDNGIYSPAVIYSNQQNSFELRMKKDVVGYVSVEVLDIDTQEPVSGANVELLKSSNSESIDSKLTDNTGFVTFAVKENVNYKVVINHNDYIIKEKLVSVKQTVNEKTTVSVKRVDQQTQKGVLVSVVNKDNTPVEFATVKVWNAENNTLVKTVISDIQGKAMISNLDTQLTYYVEAIAGIYTAKSNSFLVKEREETNVPVIMEIGEGTYNLHIVDNLGDPISTNIKVYENIDSVAREITSKATTTDTEGNTLIRIRADKIVYFVIDNFESKFITKNYHLEANNTLKETIILPKVTNASNIEFLGLYNNKDEVVTSVSPGQGIKAKFILNVSKDYTKAVAHIRTGLGDKCDETTHLLEEDDIYIKEVRFAGNKVIGSTSFSPCNGEHKDLTSITKRDGKWFNVIIDKPLVGSYLIEADLVITENATETLPLFYRSEFQLGNNILRYPVDSTLNNNVSVSNKQALYAYAKQAAVYIGASNFCNSDLCYNFSVLDKTTNITRNIVDKYSAKTSTDYTFNFAINLENKAMPNTAISITSGNSLRLDKYIINGANAQIISGSSEFENIVIGNLSGNDHISGELDLSVVNDETDTLVFSILSNNEVVFSKNITFEIKPSLNLNVEILPKLLVPFINNDVFVQVTDDEQKPISKAIVNVKVNENYITKGETDSNGVYAFTLPATDLADVVEIIVKKRGYDTFNFKTEIHDKLVTTNPESLEAHIDVSKEVFKKLNFDLINNTVLPLTIYSMNGNDSKYFTIEGFSSENMILEPNSKIPFNFSVKLTKDGLNLMTPKTIDTEVEFVFRDNQLNKAWHIKIPLNVRITFGKALDSTDCLTMDPMSQDIVVSDDGEEFDFTVKLKNNCTVDGESVSLGIVGAYIDWQASKKPLGELYTVISGREVPIVSIQDDTSKVTKVLDNLIADKEEAIKFTFKAKNIKKGVAQPTINFVSNRANVNGIDQVKSTLETNVVINNFAACLEVPQTMIQVPQCKMNNQYMTQMYQGYFGYNPTQYMGGNINEYSGTVGTNYTASTFYTNPYMNPMYSQMMQQKNFVDMSGTNNNTNMFNAFQQGGNLGCQPNIITIKNSCAQDVDIKLDAQYGVFLNSDKEFSIKKGDTKFAGVVGGQQYGLFRIGLLAKLSNLDIEEYDFVKDIQVKVAPEVEDVAGCISATETNFDFSDIKPSRKTMSIINSCFDQGVKLNEINVKNIDAMNVSGVTYFSFANQNKATVTPINKTFQTVKGKRLEIWTIAFTRSPVITEKLVTMKGRKLSEIATELRLGTDFLTRGMIELNPQIGVGFMTPKGESDEHVISVTLTDRLQWLGLGLGNMFDNPTSSAATDKVEQPSTTSNIDTATGTENGQPVKPTEVPDMNKTQTIETSDDSDDKDSLLESEVKDIEFFVDNSEEGYIVTMKVNPSKINFISQEDMGRVCYRGNVTEFLNNRELFSKVTNESYITDKDKTEAEKLEVETGAIRNQDVFVLLDFPTPKKGEKFKVGQKYRLCVQRPLRELTENETTINNFLYTLGADKPKYYDIKDTKTVWYKIWSLFKEEEELYKNIRFRVQLELDKEELAGKYLASSGYLDGSPQLDTGKCLDPKGFKEFGLTGTQNYNLYGFDKMLYNWNYEDIKANEFDFGTYYIDQDQLHMVMNKKAAILEKAEDEAWTKIGDNIFEIDGNNKPIKRIKLNMDFNYSKELEDKFNDMMTNTDSVDSETEGYLDILDILLSSNVPDELKEFTIIDVSNIDFAKKVYDFDVLVKDSVKVDLNKDKMELVSSLYETLKTNTQTNVQVDLLQDTKDYKTNIELLQHNVAKFKDVKEQTDFKNLVNSLKDLNNSLETAYQKMRTLGDDTNRVFASNPKAKDSEKGDYFINVERAKKLKSFIDVLDKVSDINAGIYAFEKEYNSKKEPITKVEYKFDNYIDITDDIEPILIDLNNNYSLDFRELKTNLNLIVEDNKKVIDNITRVKTTIDNDVNYNKFISTSKSNLEEIKVKIEEFNEHVTKTLTTPIIAKGNRLSVSTDILSLKMEVENINSAKTNLDLELQNTEAIFAEVDSNLTSVDFANKLGIVKAELESIENILSIKLDNEFIYEYDSYGKTHYQFTVKKFLDNIKAYKAYVLGLNNEDKKQDVLSYLRILLENISSSSNLYYGSSVNKFVVNTKGFDSNTTNLIMGGNFGSAASRKFVLEGTNEFSETPNTHLITIVKDTSGSDYKYSVTDASVQLKNFVDKYANNNNYKANVLFNTPINASYFTLGDVPFLLDGKVRNAGGLAASKESTFEYWDSLQDGFIFELSNGSINFKDIRPLQLISNRSFSYKLIYNYGDAEYKSPQNWYVQTNGVIRNISYSFNSDEQHNEYLLKNYNNMPSKFKNTFFVFNNFVNGDYQLRISSSEQLTNNLGLIEEAGSATNFHTNLYIVPSNLSSNKTYKGIDTTSFNSIMKGIKDEKICFNIENNELKLWINPVNVAIQSIEEK